jgi:hypothetical protein
MDNPLDPDCVCHGNWRSIVKETQQWLGDEFECEGGYEPHKGRGWYFYGIVYGDDDLYYGMVRDGRHLLLSCVGSIDGHGFKRVACGHMWRGDPDAVETREKCVKCGETRERLARSKSVS